MRTTIEVDLLPFEVPEDVETRQRVDVSKHTFYLREIDAETLDRMCYEFKREVFKKAGKQMPPTCE